ncbi:MAG: hypothetical protein MJ057_03065 [Sphaerochaetaceae bacterium]|nr:hypothetical protein [Sphaerochaetaceae bacterium]
MGKGSYGFPGLRNVSRTGVPTNYISSNLKSIERNFGLNASGYIAKKFKNTPNRRTHLSSDPVDSAKRLFRILGRGGVQVPIRNRDGIIKGWKRIMKGGDVITYRPRESSDGSTVVDINITSNHSGVKSQKIHFYKKEAK